MKENIIQTIVADMQRDLDCRQIVRLKDVLQYAKFQQPISDNTCLPIKRIKEVAR